MISDALASAIATVSAGRWAVGVSGGPDSVCLLALLRERPDLSLHVVHLNHETRRADSDADAAFVQSLADEWGLPSTIRRISDLPTPNVPNAPARFRAARFALFADVCQRENLHGVILGHQADDQAETVMHRLLRGAAPASLAGIAPRTTIRGLTVLHPLLGVRREQIIADLTTRGIAWRVDASNASPRYARNRVRQMLHGKGDLVDRLIDLGGACNRWATWLDSAAPILPESFRAEQVAGSPAPLVEQALRRWLCDRGAPPAEVTAAAVGRLLAMVTDLATPPRQHFPGRILVTRRRGTILSSR